MNAMGWDPAEIVLVVDLDQAVKRPDSALEAFWAASSARWFAPFVALASLPRGVALVRTRLEELACTVPARLSYSDDVLVSVRQWRARGGRVALLARNDQHVARGVAAHLGLFDETHGLAGASASREDYLDGLYGQGGYAVIEDTAATDVGGHAEPAVTAHARSSARMPALLRLMRPHQWLKNLLVFVPMLAGHELTAAAIWHSVLAFIAFSLIASSTYVLNDLLDLGADRAHPRKRRRPLASGAVGLAQGTLLMPALALAGVAVALLSGPALLGMLALYFAATTAYSFRLKRLVVIDICALAVLYTMRILAGSVAADIPCSVWLLAFSTFFFFSLAAVKRQAELVDGIASGTITAHGRGYHVDDLAIVNNIAVSSGMVSVLVLALYANSEPVQRLYHVPEMLWGICLVLLFWNSRIAILTQRGQMHDDPLVFAARDRVSLLCAAAIGALAVAGAVL